MLNYIYYIQVHDALTHKQTHYYCMHAAKHTTALQQLIIMQTVHTNLFKTAAAAALYTVQHPPYFTQF